jgi:hypothetical protein
MPPSHQAPHSAFIAKILFLFLHKLFARGKETLIMTCVRKNPLTYCLKSVPEHLKILFTLYHKLSFVASVCEGFEDLKGIRKKISLFTLFLL